MRFHVWLSSSDKVGDQRRSFSLGTVPDTASTVGIIDTDFMFSESGL